MRLLTWNVNGIRAVMKKGFTDIMVMLDPDFVCIQETKAQKDQIVMDEGLYPYIYTCSAQKKGYSGTMIMTRYQPLSVAYGIGDPVHDTEGRVITLEYADCYVITVYTPNAGEGLKRLEYRQAWDAAFARYIGSLKKPVLLCGDFNVARGPMDIFDEKDGQNTAGYTPQEKEGFETRLLPLVQDAWRQLYPNTTGKYTWWSYYSRGREKNRGWRIDYWLVSPAWMDRVRDVEILDDIYGSDHCPVLLDIDWNIE